MGKIITARYTDILPSEDGFLPSKIKRLVDFHRAGKEVLPTTIREDYNFTGKYDILNGSHRLIYGKMAGRESGSLYLAKSPEDIMQNSDFPGIETHLLNESNRFISQRWFTSEKISYMLGFKDFNEFFKSLVSNFPFLRDISSFEKHIAENPHELRRHYMDGANPQSFAHFELKY